MTQSRAAGEPTGECPMPNGIELGRLEVVQSGGGQDKRRGIKSIGTLGGHSSLII